MERRELLRAGVGAGMLFIGNRIRPIEAATAAGAKPITSAYTGPMEIKNQEESEIIFEFGVVHGKLVGKIYIDDVPTFVVNGTLKKGKLKAVATYYGDPTLYFADLNGKGKGSKLTGKLTKDGFDKGTFAVTKKKTDVATMKDLAGDYEGIVNEGPPFTGNCIVKSNGTFRLYDVVDTEGKPIKGQIPGYYVAWKEPSAGSEGPVIEGAAYTIFLLLFYFCAGEACNCVEQEDQGDSGSGVARLMAANQTKMLSQMRSPTGSPQQVAAAKRP